MVKRQEIMGCESVDMVRFDLGTLLQGQMRIAKIESAYNSLIKRPARDACLCMGELLAPAAPAAPHFVFLITL